MDFATSSLNRQQMSEHKYFVSRPIFHARMDDTQRAANQQTVSPRQRMTSGIWRSWTTCSQIACRTLGHCAPMEIGTITLRKTKNIVHICSTSMSIDINKFTRLLSLSSCLVFPYTHSFSSTPILVQRCIPSLSKHMYGSSKDL